MKIGERVKEIRLQQGLTQTELSEKCGMTVRTIQRIENHEVSPSLHSLKMLSDALQIPLSEFQDVKTQKPYQFEFKLTITDMNQFIEDLKTLIKNNWKILLIISLIIYLLTNYTDIKSGILDGWNNR